MGKLNHKVAIITGSARGIGKQIALCFAKEGADIIICDTKTVEMELTSQEIRDLGRKVIAISTDVAKKEEVAQLVNTTMANFKKVDILVNNAGIFRRAGLMDTTEEDWDDVLDVNLKGVFLCTQAVAKCMIEQKYGKIVNIASVNGVGSSDVSKLSYSAAKAGVVQLTKNCALELGAYGINVNAIAPGTIATDMSYVGRTPAQASQFLEQRAKLAILNRVGAPQDIANLALFLASDDSSFITGQVIVADGGRADRM